MIDIIHVYNGVYNVQYYICYIFYTLHLIHTAI